MQVLEICMVHLNYMRGEYFLLRVVPLNGKDDFAPLEFPGFVESQEVRMPSSSGNHRLGDGLERRYYFRMTDGTRVQIYARGSGKVRTTDKKHLLLELSFDELESFLTQIE